MSDLYVRSTDGDNGENGSTWALAKATLAGAAAIDVAGDTIWLSDGHAESSASAQAITLAGTGAAPVRVLCGDDAAEPPTALAATATVVTTGTNNITISGTGYFYGIAFTCGDSTGAPTFHLGGNSQAGDVQRYKNCDFILGASGANSRIEIGSSTTTAVPIRVLWDGVDVKFGGASQGIGVSSGDLVWSGGGILAGSTALTTALFRGTVGAVTNKAGSVLVQGVDFTNLDQATNIFDAAGYNISKGVFRNCKLPAAWTGTLTTGALRPSQRFEMYNCDDGDTNYSLWIEDYAGSIRDEITIVRTGGASDGTTGLAWKMAASANAEYPAIILDSPAIVLWNEDTGAEITVDVEVVHDEQGGGTSGDLTDGEAWLEVQYLGTSGFPISSFVSSAKADVLAAAADIANSAADWTTTGLTTPVKQTLSVSFTPQEKGFIHAKVHLAKASATVYVDPKLTVS